MHHSHFRRSAYNAICPPFGAFWVRMILGIEIDDMPKVLLRSSPVQDVVRQVVGNLRLREGTVDAAVFFRGL
jgi:hypothetical protein